MKIILKGNVMSNNVVFFPQITPEQIAHIKSQGFATIINNRPDGEEINQLTHAEIAQAVTDAGLDYHFLPIIGGQMTQQDVEKFAEIFNQAKKPVFMFCRTGNRSNVLYQSAKHLDLLD